VSEDGGTTTITVTGDALTDHTFSNNFYSRAEYPFGFTYVKDDIRASAYQSATMTLGQTLPCKLYFDTEMYNPGGYLDNGVLVSGTATSDSENHLVDSGADFINDGVIAGHLVEETTGGNFARVTEVTATDLTLSADIFPNGNENYQIKKSRFVAPVKGCYSVKALASFYQDNKDVGNHLYVIIYKNGVPFYERRIVSGSTTLEAFPLSADVELDVGEYVEIWVRNSSSADNTIYGGTRLRTSFYVHFVRL
jgi:hypothetical protein